MKPKHVAALAALGLTGLLGLVLLWRASQAAGETTPDSASAREPASASDSSQRPRPELPASTRTEGDLPAILDEDIDAGARGARAYVRDDGVLMRDHRARTTMLTPTELARPKTGPVKVEPTAIIAVRNAMRPIVFRCAEAVPAASMGADPRLQGEVMVSIAGGKLSVDDTVVKVVDVDESAAAPMRDCVVQGVRDIHLAVPEAADVTRATLTLPFRLRQ